MIAKLILLGLMTLSLGMGIATHGHERKPNNGWTSLISYVLILTLLYFSGFFNGLIQTI